MSADNTAAPRLNIDFYLDVICQTRVLFLVFFAQE